MLFAGRRKLILCEFISIVPLTKYSEIILLYLGQKSGHAFSLQFSSHLYFMIVILQITIFYVALFMGYARIMAWLGYLSAAVDS
jgi:hypothetical protein